MRPKPTTKRTSLAIAGGEELAFVALFIILGGVAGLWAGMQIAGLATSGQFPDGSIGDAIKAIPKLVQQPSKPGAAWPDSNGAPQPINAWIYWPATMVTSALGLLFSIIRLLFSHPVGTEHRTRLGVNTNAKLATLRDLKPLIVTAPTPGRFIIGLFQGRLLATENRRRNLEPSKRDGDRSAVAVIGPARSGKTANVISGVLTWHGPAILSSVRDDLFTRTLATRIYAWGSSGQL